MINNTNLLKSERQSRIRQLIDERRQVTVPEISALFQVSEVTIRRDLDEMAERGEVQRTHGGALSRTQMQKEPPVIERMNEQRAEKQRIGRAAAQLVSDGETIFLGSGTTLLEMARCLPHNIGLTVITNSIPVISELGHHPNIDLVVIGGILRKSEQAMVGHIAERDIYEFRADQVFMGIRSIDVAHGFTNDDFPDTVFDRALFQISQKVIVLADHTKFGRVSLVHVAPLSAAHMIITDQKIAPGTVEQIKTIGPQVLAV